MCDTDRFEIVKQLPNKADPAECHWVVRRRRARNAKQPWSPGRRRTLGDTTMSLYGDSRGHIDYRSVRCGDGGGRWTLHAASREATGQAAQCRRPSQTFASTTTVANRAAPSISTTTGEDRRSGMPLALLRTPALGPLRPMAARSTRLSRLWREGQQLSVHVLLAPSGGRAAASA